jgi:chorismate mutase
MTNHLPDYETQLAQIRARIDEVDAILAESLLHRLQLADEIGRLKARTRTLAMSETRQTEIIDRLATQFPELHRAEINAVWQILFRLSITRQLRIIDK